MCHPQSLPQILPFQNVLPVQIFSSTKTTNPPIPIKILKKVHYEFYVNINLLLKSKQE